METEAEDGTISDGSTVNIGEDLESFFVSFNSLAIICIVIGIIYSLIYWGIVALLAWIFIY